MSKKFIHKALLSYVIWVAASGCLVWLVAIQYQPVEKTVVTPAGSAGLKNIEKIWYQAQQGFVAARADGQKIETLKLKPAAAASGQVETAPIAKWTLPQPGTAYAVSPDGTRLAMLAGNELEVSDATGKSTAAQGNGHPLKKVAWPDSGLIAALSTDGSVTFFDQTSLKPIGTEAGLKGADLLEAAGQYYAVANRETGEVRVIDGRELPNVKISESRKLNQPIVSMLVSRGGRLVLGTDSGTFVGGTFYPAAGAVRTMTFDHEGDLIYAGDFPSVDAAMEGKPVAKFAENTGPTQAMAADTHHLVFAGPGGLRFVSVEKGVEMNSYTQFLIKMWLAVNIAVLIAFAVRAGMAVYAYLMRKRKLGEADKLVSTLGRMKPPDDMVEALRRNELVLVVGEGLSSASSLPDWPHFVRRLADWAIELEHVVEPEARKLRTFVNAGDLEKAMDLITARIGPDRVRDYARGSYVRIAPLSNLHEKLSAIPFCAAVNGCLDQLVEKAMFSPKVLIPADSRQATQALKDSGWFIMRLRGDWNREETVRIRPQEAAARNASEPDYTQFVDRLLNEQTTLFIGMTVDEIALWFDLRKEQRTGRSHYALIPEATVSRTRSHDAMCQRNNIRPLLYAADESSHVIAFLEALRASAPRTIRTRFAGPAA